MELREYISITLTDIIGGIEDAQEEIKQSESRKNKGTLINPKGAFLDKGNIQTFVHSISAPQRIVERIEFEVLVELEAGEEGKVGIGVFSGVLGIGGQAKLEDKSTEANRLKFSIPVVFPSP